MSGLMEYAMSVSPLNTQRLYVLTQPSAADYQGIPGLYTSADQGRTWKLSIAAASISSRYIYTEAAGNDSPDEVYIYLAASTGVFVAVLLIVPIIFIGRRLRSRPS